MTDLPDYDWRALANCYGVDAAVFFGDDTEEHRLNPRPAVAKKICGRCDVAIECLDEALKMREPWGIWGGLTPKERARLAPVPWLGRHLESTA